MSPIVLSKEKKTITPKQNTSMSPIVLSNNKNKTRVLCHPLCYLKKKEDNNTKTKHEFYVTHCFI